MPGTMSRPDLVDSLKGSILDAATIFTEPNDGAFRRHLDAAAADFRRIRPRTLVGSVTVVADQADYTLPTGFLGLKSSLWGIAPQVRVKPWDKAWPGRLPRAEAANVGGVDKLYLTPPPTSQQIALLGAEYRFFYFAAHVIGDVAAGTTIAAGDRCLLIQRAQVEALRELAMRNMGKPVSVNDGLSGTPKNGTPGYLAIALLREWEHAGGIGAAAPVRV